MSGQVKPIWATSWPAQERMKGARPWRYMTSERWSSVRPSVTYQYIWRRSCSVRPTARYGASLATLVLTLLVDIAPLRQRLGRRRHRAGGDRGGADGRRETRAPGPPGARASRRFATARNEIRRP